MIFDKKTELKTFAVYEKRPDIFCMGGDFFSIQTQLYPFSHDHGSVEFRAVFER